MKHGRFAVLLILILVGGTAVNAWNLMGEVSVQRKELKGFPRQVGTWEQTGGDEKFNNETMAVLRASDYLLRNYKAPDGRMMNFYVGYYASQRDGATYHSPLNCLPGSGWTMTEPGKITIRPEGRTPFLANRYLIQNGGRKELLIYWYQGRGRSTANEYWGKVYTVIDSVRLRRSDAAMVRITTPVRSSDADALISASQLAAQVSTILPDFIPD